LILYLDTSVVLRVILASGKQLEDWGHWSEACSSELMGVEVRRSIDRLRLDQALDDQGVAAAARELGRVEREIGRIRLSRRVLHRASLPMATAVKTLDAIHLASALLFQERRSAPVVFASHDFQQSLAATALGFSCIGTPDRLPR